MLTYKYKLEPNRKQRQLLLQQLDLCRGLYNMLLEQKQYQRIGQFEQMRQLTELKQVFPEYKTAHAHMLQNVVKKLDRAFQGFFRRTKSGAKAGYPRFKGKNRYNSLNFSDGCKLEGKQLSVSKIGNIKVRLSRELPKDAVQKTCTIKRSANGWFATITFEHTPVPLPKSNKKIGVDVGITQFAALSNGEFIPNRRFYEQGQAELRRAQRRVARRTNKKSNRRRKAVVLLQKVHARIVNRRMDFLHKESTKLVQRFGTIVVEALNVAAMSRGNLSKQILDCSWSEFFGMLSYKAENAGRIKAEEPPQYTSQKCAECGFIHRDNRKTQADFVCLSCGHADNADTNGARNHLANYLARIEPSSVNASEVMLCVG
jgi:putative transposase